MTAELSPYQLTITTPLKLGNIPSQEAIIQAGVQILESVKDWRKGKVYHGVQTFSRPKQAIDGAPWHCRLSEHAAEEVTFDQLWSKLGVNKPEHEKQFIPEVHSVTLIKEVSDTQSVWSMHYKFPPPVSPRVFTELQVTELSSESPRAGTIVSIPIDLSSPGDEEYAKLETKGVKGKYVSVERIRELENGNTEWIMATSSTPGGSIPSFIVESTMASTISQDVPHLLKWLKSLPNEES
ncbi:hypothetical protein ONZ45_g3554 [Pleurotus djamor]|nr:hypothetical protein ONZ45_g3554 [Pleurotus djamor]